MQRDVSIDASGGGLQVGLADRRACAKELEMRDLVGETDPLNRLDSVLIAQLDGVQMKLAWPATGRGLCGLRLSKWTFVGDVCSTRRRFRRDGLALFGSFGVLFGYRPDTPLIVVLPARVRSFAGGSPFERAMQRAFVREQAHVFSGLFAKEGLRRRFTPVGYASGLRARQE